MRHAAGLKQPLARRNKVWGATAGTREKHRCCNSCYKRKTFKKIKKKAFAICESRTTTHELLVKENLTPPTALGSLSVAENIHWHHQMGRIPRFLLSHTLSVSKIINKKERQLQKAALFFSQPWVCSTFTAYSHLAKSRAARSGPRPSLQHNYPLQLGSYFSPPCYLKENKTNKTK